MIVARSIIACARSVCFRTVGRNFGAVQRRKRLGQTTFGYAALLLIVQSTAFSQPSETAQKNWAERLFEKTSHDFGDVARGSNASYRFKIKNIYRDPVHILDVRTSCGCTAGKPSKDTFKALEEGFVEVTMDTKKFIRQKNSNLIITFDAPLRGEVTLPISAYIRTDVVLKPGGATFGVIPNGEKKQRKIAISYAGRDDWTIRGVRTRSKFITATVNETSRSAGRAEFELVVTLKENAPIGSLREQIFLETDDQDSPSVPVLVEATVEPDIVVTPKAIPVGSLRAGQMKTFNVVVRGKESFIVDRVESNASESAFQIRLPKKQAKLHILYLRVKAPERTGKLDEEFSIHIAGQRAPIKFRATGRVIGL